MLSYALQERYIEALLVTSQSNVGNILPQMTSGDGYDDNLPILVKMPGTLFCF